MFGRFKQVISTIKVAGLRKPVGNVVGSVLAKVPISTWIKAKGTRRHKSHYYSSKPFNVGEFKQVISDIEDLGHRKHVENAVESIVANVPMIAGIKLRGTRPHKSHYDRSNPLIVITVDFFKLNKRNKGSKRNSWSRVASGHVFGDGTANINFRRRYRKYQKNNGDRV